VSATGVAVWSLNERRWPAIGAPTARQSLAAHPRLLATRKPLLSFLLSGLFLFR